MNKQLLPSRKALKLTFDLILNTIPPFFVAGLITKWVDLILRLTLYQEQRVAMVLFFIALPYWFHLKLLLFPESVPKKLPKNEVEIDLNNLKADQGIHKMNDAKE